jgi:hypothetical protein
METCGHTGRICELSARLQRGQPDRDIPVGPEERTVRCHERGLIPGSADVSPQACPPEAGDRPPIGIVRGKRVILRIPPRSDRGRA